MLESSSFSSLTAVSQRTVARVRRGLAGGLAIGGGFCKRLRRRSDGDNVSGSQWVTHDVP